MPKHLIPKRRRWYATLEIPKSLRKYFGKVRFQKSLQTDSLTEAEIRKHHYIGSWKIQIEEARTGKRSCLRDQFNVEGSQWKRDYENSRGEDRDTLDDVLDEMPKYIQKFIRGTSIATGEYVDSWIATLEDTEKTKDDKRSAVVEFSKEFPYSDKVNRQTVKEWVHKLRFTKNMAAVTVNKKLSFMRRYWKFLQSAGHLKGDDEPFKNVMESPKKDKTKASGKKGWVAFTDDEAVGLLRKAASDGDNSLAALIWLDMWTGCRIEELCSLKLEDVLEDRFRIIDAKTLAGIREVPIHSRLRAAVSELKDTSNDLYLISGLTFNTYGHRSNAIGKRFGRMKTDLSFSSRHVFHSLRKTVTTQFHNKGIQESQVADIVGHDESKKGITYGTYSAGIKFEVKQRIVEFLSYNVEDFVFSNVAPMRQSTVRRRRVATVSPQ